MIDMISPFFKGLTMKRSLLPLLPLLLTVGCATKLGTLVPGENQHIAIGTGFNDLDSVKMATATADDYCGEMQKRSAVDDIQTDYKGIVTKETRDNTNTVVSVARIAGVHLPALGSDSDYKTVAKFRCL